MTKVLPWLILLALSLAQTLHAQEVNIDSNRIPDQAAIKHRIHILSDRYNRTHEINGYRIQIISSSKKEAARRAKSEFVKVHQEIVAYEIYQQPFFIVKVGDFLTKLEAEKFHRDIKAEYPDSFVLPDAIDPYKQYAEKKDKD